jgi:uncharacterized membrane protein YdjX (TVP38/TMEM64 family)
MARGDAMMAFGPNWHPRRATVIAAAAVTLAGGAVWLVLNHAQLPSFDAAWIHGLVSGLGIFGPLVLVGLMVLAIVVSPIPSGPIAVAAGMLYGADGGAVVSIVGAEIGALLAFSMARYFGYEAIRRSNNPVMRFIAVPRSQGALMGIVFASRLIPFISFDAISYATGLTNLSFARFAIATALGIVPICWTLAAMGAGMATGGIDWFLVVVFGGAITLLPALVAALRAWSRP